MLCKDIPYLDDFFEILRQDDESNKQTHYINMRSAALNLMVFIESTIKERFRIDGLKLLKGKDKDVFAIVSDVYIESRKNDDGGKTPVQVSLFSGLTPAGEDWWRVSSQSDIALICATLIKYYEIPCYQVNKIISLKNDRNQSIAHGNGPIVEIKKDRLKDIFDNVIRSMLAKF